MPDYSHLHKNLKGAGDQRPTAMQIVENENLVGNMKDKVFLLTGASAGIGVETGRALAATGGKVYLAVRNLEKAQKACGDFLEPGRVELLKLDVGSLASVRAAAAEFLSKESKLNVLVCNAGIMAVPTLELTADGFESQLAVNYLGHFLLFHLLKDALLKASTPEFNSRLVHVASSSHHVGDIYFDDFSLQKEGAYGPEKAYGQAKLAQIYHSNWVDRHLGPRGLHSTSLMPGGILTNLQQYVPAETKASWVENKDIQNFMKSEAQGGATTVYAAVSEDWEGKGGKYLEDCRVATLEPFVHYTMGYKPFIYDQEKEDKLYEHTLKVLGLSS